jgi:hypothetical protein
MGIERISFRTSRLCTSIGPKYNYDIESTENILHRNNEIGMETNLGGEISDH